MAAKGLGRGLSALLGEDAIAAGPTVTRMLAVADIEPNPGQPRRRFDAEALEALADSIRTHGLLQPIAVRRHSDGDRYMIIAGERRWRAARLAGLTEVPVVMLEADDRRAAELALVENLQREDLNPLEEAEGFRALMQDFGLTQEETASRVGRSRPAVANALRLLALCPAVQELLRSAQLSAGHARTLAPLSEALQTEAAQKAIDEGLSVRQLESLVSRFQKEKKDMPAEGFSFDGFDEIQRRLSDSLGRRIVLKNGRKKGRIEIEYYGNDDLENLIRLLEEAAER